MSNAPDDEMPYDDGLPDSKADGRRYASLDVGLTDQGMPIENHSFIRQFTSAIGIAEFHERGDYIKAVRVGEGPDIQIHYGWSNGFVSEAEIDAAAGPGAVRWPSNRGRDQWGVTHPVHGSWSSGGKKTGNPRLDYGTCPKCQQYTLLPTGGCSGGCED